MKDFNEFSPHSGVEVNIMPVIGDSSLLKLDESELRDALPILALRNAVIFPGTVFPVTIGREKSIRVIRDVEAPTYDEAVNEQIQNVRASAKAHTFDELTATLEQWS